MNRNIIAFGIVVVVVFAVFGLSKVSAYRGDYAQYGPNHTQEREEAMYKVMSEKDYEGWKTLMTQDGRTPGVLNKIDTQEEFNMFAEAYILAKEGKVDEANAIRSELGLGNGQRGGQHRGGGFVDTNGNGVCDRME